MSLWPGGRVPAAGENPSSNICAAADFEGVAGGLIFPLRSQTSVQTNQSMLVAWTDKKDGLQFTGLAGGRLLAEEYPWQHHPEAEQSHEGSGGCNNFHLSLSALG